MPDKFRIQEAKIHDRPAFNGTSPFSVSDKEAMQKLGIPDRWLPLAQL